MPLIYDNVLLTAGGEECPPSTDTTQEKEQQGSIDVANSKEKTPMCLVNELARFNKVNFHFSSNIFFFH